MVEEPVKWCFPILLTSFAAESGDIMNLGLGRIIDPSQFVLNPHNPLEV